jgi:DNA-binding CsgD family transcriptional regulator
MLLGLFYKIRVDRSAKREREDSAAGRLNCMAFAGFTRRELQVIGLRAKGLKSREIAIELGCSRPLIYNYIHSVTRKTGIKDREEFSRWAVQFGLDEPLDAEPDIP